MDGRRGAAGFRVTPGVGRSVQPDNPRAPAGQPGSNWTTSPVHTDRTDTANPELVASPCRSKAALYRVIGRRGTATLCLKSLGSQEKTGPCPQRSDRPRNINEKTICERSQMVKSGGGRTPIELFVTGVSAWQPETAGLVRSLPESI
jgi:hypothetical protein